MRTLILGLAAVASLAAALPAAAQPVGFREHRQEQRIEQGLRRGDLTPREAFRLQRREARLHRTEARMRFRNGGHLNRFQRARLERMENRDSRAIFHARHNGRRAF